MANRPATVEADRRWEAVPTRNDGRASFSVCSGIRKVLILWLVGAVGLAVVEFEIR